MAHFSCNGSSSRNSLLFTIVAVALAGLLGLHAQPIYSQTPAYGTWAAAGQLTAAHSNSAAATLKDGRILITGGVLAGYPVAGAEIYDGSAFVQAAAMSVPRASHTTSTLRDGRVIVVGGFTAPNIPTNSIEIFDPATDAWSSVPRGLQQARGGHTMTVLQDGRIVIAGGMGPSGPLNTIEIFDPSANASTLLDVTLTSPRVDHAAALLSTGWVLFAGGFDGNKVLATVEGYNPTTGAMLSPITMASPRRYLSATDLLDGRVLLAGGNDGNQDLATIEIFNMATASITPGGSLAVARSHHSAIRLPDNGNVLFAGGQSSGTPVASAEMFVAVSGSIQPAGTMSSARADSTVAWLIAGSKAGALVVGGDATALNSTADVYTFPHMSTDKPDYAPNTTVTVTGNGWAPGEAITLVFHENPTHDADVTVAATADASGTFVNTGFKPDLHDESLNFVLTATGAQSGATAQVVFSDSTYSTSMYYLNPSSGASGSAITVQSQLFWAQPQYSNQYYYYNCNCYSCNCGWFSCGTCCNTCQGSYQVFDGYYNQPLGGQTVEFAFNTGSPVSVTTDYGGYATASIVVPVGATQLTAKYQGSSDGTYGAAQQTISFTVTNSPTTLTVSSASAPYGTASLTLSATLSVSSSGAPVSSQSVYFAINGSGICSANTNVSGVAQCTVSAGGVPPGQSTISASFAGTSSYQASSGSNTITITRGTQAALYVAESSPATYGTTQTLGTFGGSGSGAVTFSAVGTACSLSGSTLTITSGTGTCSVTATKAADVDYNSATSSPTYVTVQQAPQPALVVNATSPATYNVTQLLSTTGGGGTGALTYSAGSSTACTVSGSRLTITAGTGTCSVTAAKAADSNYHNTISPTVTITVQPAAQAALVFNVDPSGVYSSSQSLSATGGSGIGAITFSVGSSTACSVSGSTLSITAGTGTCSVTAAKAADSNYAAATSPTRTVLVSQAPKSISFTQPVSPVNVNDTATLVATSSNGDPVYFTVSSGAASISGASVVYTASGAVTLTANSDATANFAAAAPVSFPVTVAPAPGAYIAPKTAVGATSAVQTATINFTAAGTLASVKGLTQGAADLDFNVVAGSGTCVAGQAYSAGQACTVQYLFKPTSAGTRFGALTLTDGSGNVLGTSYVSGTGTGPLGLFTTTQQTFSVSGLSVPRGLSTDGKGNVYVLGTGNNQVDVIRAGTSAATVIDTLPNSGSGGTAIDGAGNLFVSSTNDGTIYEYVSAKAPAIAIAQTCGADDNLQIDGAGNLYYSCYASQSGAIYKVDAVTHATTQALASDGSHRFIAMAVDVAGNIFAPDFNNNTLYEVVAGSGALTSLVSNDGNMSNPHGIALDPAGNIYITNYTGNSHNILRYASGNYGFTLLPAPGSRGVVIDGAGNLYSILNDDSTVEGFSRTVAPPITFPDTKVGATSNSVQGVEYENDGNAPLSVSSYNVAPPFSVSGPLNTCTTGDLAPGGSCYIGATFKPTTAGPQASVIAINSNNQNVAGSAQVVNLSGLALKGDQSIGFNSLPTTAVYGAAPLPVSATGGNSGNAVTFTVVSGPGVISGNALTVLGAGPIVVAADQAGNSDWNAAPEVTVVVAVAPEQLTAAIVGNPTKAYDGTNKATLTPANFQVLGLVNGDSVIVTQNAGTYASTSAGAQSVTSTLSPANFAVAQGSLSNYTLPAFATGAGLIQKANATVSPASFTKTYGTADPSFTGTVTGFIAGDNIVATYTRTAGETVLGGPYAIQATLSPAEALGNYNITYNTGRLAITPAKANVTAAAAGKTYGAADPALTGTLTGFLASDNVTAAYTRTAGETVVGSYSITATLSPANVLSNYAITNTPAVFTISPAPLSITASSGTMTYGGTVPTITPSFIGFVNGDGASTLTGLSCTTTAASSSLVGTYAATCTGAVNSNYVIAYTAGTVKNNPAPLSITASNASMSYGGTVPTITSSSLGFVNGDGAAMLAGLTCSTTAASSSPVGAYPSICTGAVNANYLIAYTAGTVTVSPAPISVTAANSTTVYGTPAAAFRGTIKGIVNGDAISATYSSAATVTSPVGTYAIVPALSGAALSNYTVTINNGTLTVDPAVLSVTAANASTVYGIPAVSFTGGITGIVNNDAITASYTSTATTASPVGTYAIIPALAGAALSNYTVSVNNGTLTINPALLSVTANNATRTYGSTDPAFSGVITGIVNGDAVTASYTSADNPSSSVGTYPIVPAVSGAALSNYRVTVSNGTLTVASAMLSVTAANASRTYGSANPNLTGTITGIVNGEPITASYATVATPGSAVGPYAIVPALSGGTLGNYTITVNSGTLTVTPAVLSVTANNSTRIYGSVDAAFMGTITGVVNGDGITAAYTSSDSASSPVGTYAIVPALSGSTLSNYTITVNNGTLTVTPAVLSVTANNSTRIYGSVDAAFTGTITGIVNGDGITAAYTSSDSASSPVGTYAIVPALSGSTLSNYTITMNNGTLTVTPAALVLTPANASRVYGSPNPAFTGTVTGVLNSDGIGATYSTAATSASDTGTYAITAQASDPAGKLGNYSVTVNNGTLTITKATQSLLWATPAAITYATPLSAAQMNASVSVPGVSAAGAVTYTPAPGTVLDAGVTTLTVNVAGTGNYNPATSSVQLTVNKAQTAFTGLSTETVTFHKGTVTFTGAIAAPTAVPAGQAVTVTLNGVTQTATAGANGSFSATFNTATLPVSSTGYTVSYSYAGSFDFLAARATSKLTVAYSVCYGYDPTQVKNIGSTYPIKISVCDVNGSNVATADTVVTGIGWGVSSPTYTPLPDAGNSNGGGTFRNTGGKFMWNLKTTGMAAGSYNVYFSISGDPTLHLARFAVQ